MRRFPEPQPMNFNNLIEITNNNTALNDDEGTARLYTDIANDVIPGIIMEFGVPSRNIDEKMPNLDMKVSINEDKYLLFQLKNG